MRKTIATILTITALAFAVGSAEARKMHPSELTGWSWLMGLILSE